DSESEYLLKVKAVDGLGQALEKEYPFTVVNTRNGTLYTSEVWSGEHQIDDTVIVPEDLDLTLAANTNVSVYVSPDQEKPIALIVEEGADLIHEGSARYSVTSLMDEAYWQGIILHGMANVENLYISGALRGITLSNPDITTITNCELIDNTIGLHLFGTSPFISNSLFRGNKFYGIKEDSNAAPVVRDNLFGNNGFDYYREGGFLLSSNEINHIKNENRGNDQE
ncbi:MAG: right-handed parallel beta-helix repeat-containing protein, partial [Spirochaetaceae bacterium]|nr:right-handed parallel beta-helix repeat-containing protein [Spirochaetaceae bacterium]